MEYVIGAVIALIVCLPVGFVIGTVYRKKVAEAEIGSAEEEAKRLLEEAAKAAETKKKEALIEAKEKNKTKEKTKEKTKNKEKQPEEKRKFSAMEYTVTPEADAVLAEVLFVLNDFDQLQYEGFSQEEIELYEKLKEKRNENIRRALK